MKNHANGIEPTNNQPNPADVGQIRQARFRNADNFDLWCWEKLPNGGNAPEVNGRWAEEIPEFAPTNGELLLLAERWTDVAIRRTWVEWANAPVSVNVEHWRHVYFAWRRVYRIRSLVGEIIDRVVNDRIKNFFEEKDGAHWDPGAWNEFARLIDPEAQKTHLGPLSNNCDPSFSASSEM